MKASDRIGYVAIGVFVLALGAWIFFIVHSSADGDGWFNFGVRLVIGEFAFATLALGGWLVVSAFIPASYGEAVLGWLASKVYFIAIAIAILTIIGLTFVAAAILGFCEWVGLL